MAPPAVTIYVTSLTSAPKVRKHIELLRRSLKGLEIPYEEFDLVMDEDAKKRWQRAKPAGAVIGLPGYLVGGQFVGTMEDFEDAVETQTLETFLKQDMDLGPSTSGASGSAGGSKTIEEAELEALMRELTNEDLDKLVGELDVPGASEGVGKVGLMVEPGEAPPPAPAPEPAPAGVVPDSPLASVSPQLVSIDAPLVAVAAAGEAVASSATKAVEDLVKDTGATAGPEAAEAAEHAQEGAQEVKEGGLGISTGVQSVEKAEPGKEKTLDEVVDQAIHADGKEKVE